MRMDQLTAPEIKLANPVVPAVRLCTNHCSHVEEGSVIELGVSSSLLREESTESSAHYETNMWEVFRMMMIDGHYTEIVTSH